MQPIIARTCSFTRFMSIPLVGCRARLPESILQENTKLKRDRLDLKGENGAALDAFYGREVIGQITKKSLAPGVRRGDDTVILNFRFEHQE